MKMETSQLIYDAAGLIKSLSGAALGTIIAYYAISHSRENRNDGLSGNMFLPKKYSGNEKKTDEIECSRKSISDYLANPENDMLHIRGKADGYFEDSDDMHLSFLEESIIVTLHQNQKTLFVEGIENPLIQFCLNYSDVSGVYGAYRSKATRRFGKDKKSHQYSKSTDSFGIIADILTESSEDRQYKIIFSPESIIFRQ